MHARVNGDLALEFDDVPLTSSAGLELLQRYLRRMRLNALIRTACRGAHEGGDFGGGDGATLMALLVVGGRRLDHIAYVADDPLFRRLCRLQILPTPRTVSRWLRHFTMETVERLQVLNAAVIAHVVPGVPTSTSNWPVNQDTAPRELSPEGGVCSLWLLVMLMSVANVFPARGEGRLEVRVSGGSRP